MRTRCECGAPAIAFGYCANSLIVVAIIAVLVVGIVVLMLMR